MLKVTFYSEYHISLLLLCQNFPIQIRFGMKTLFTPRPPPYVAMDTISRLSTYFAIKWRKDISTESLYMLVILVHVGNPCICR